MVVEGNKVTGVDLKGNLIQGEVTNVLKTFQVAIVRTGEDRVNVTQAYLSDLRGVEE